MSLPQEGGRGVIPASYLQQHSQNPKSILSDKSHNNQHQPNVPTNSALLRGLNNDLNISNLRVTFAKASARRSTVSSVTSVNNPAAPQPPPSPKGKVTGSASSASTRLKGRVPPNKYNFGIFPQKKEEADKSQEQQETKSEDSGKSGGGGGEESAKMTKLGRRSAKNISILYPTDKYKKNIMNKGKATPAISSASTGLISLRGKSEETLARASRSTAKSSPGSSVKPAGRKPLSLPKRVKSGKKLKKRKKSKLGQQQDADLDSIKPAKFNEEYATELNKITQILKAVSAFDEATSTDTTTGGTKDGYYLPSKNNLVTSYTYTSATESAQKSSVWPAVGATMATTTPQAAIGGGSLTNNSKQLQGGLISPSSGQARRPLSGDELKQLLSSITRVVSLHHLPVNGDAGAAENKNNEDEANATTWGDVPETKAESTESSGSKRGKKKKSRKSFHPSRTGSASDLLTTSAKSAIRKAKLSGGKTALMGASTTFGSTSSSRAKSVSSHLRKLSTKTKHKSSRPHYMKPKKAVSDNSVSSSEKDPVKNALFLRKYFEESTRLANKKSSEELVGEGAAAGDDNKKASKSLKKLKRKKKKRSTSVSNKVSSKTV